MTNYEALHRWLVWEVPNDLWKGNPNVSHDEQAFNSAIQQGLITVPKTLEHVPSYPKFEPFINVYSREQLIGWLIWADGNGLWSDEDCLAEGYEPLTWAGAYIKALELGLVVVEKERK